MADEKKPSITIDAPDDFHVHLRDGNALACTVPAVARQFRRCLVMPNLKPPVTSAKDALAYRERIMSVLKKEVKENVASEFEPLMSLYLTDKTTPEEIKTCREAGVVAAKLYPAGATTNSAEGVTDLQKLYPVLGAMAEHKMLLLVHGEVTDPSVDIFDREAQFIDRVLKPIVKDFPTLKIVMEHITTAQAAEYVASAPDTVAATITAHHLLYNRNAIFKGGLNPHFYCLPVLKRETHRLKLTEAATSGSPKFFAGTDSAPHAKHSKETCGCAGCYTSHAAVELYAEVFDSCGALDKLQAFLCENGARFYGLPLNKETGGTKRRLTRKSWRGPKEISFEDGTVVPLRAGEIIHWTMEVI